VLAGYGEIIFNFSKARKKKLAHSGEKFQVFTDTESPPIYSAGFIVSRQPKYRIKTIKNRQLHDKFVLIFQNIKI